VRYLVFFSEPYTISILAFWRAKNYFILPPKKLVYNSIQFTDKGPLVKEDEANPHKIENMDIEKFINLILVTAFFCIRYYTRQVWFPNY